MVPSRPLLLLCLFLTTADPSRRCEGYSGSVEVKNSEKREKYEAKGQVLVIHLPKELDHHNCRNLRYETDLLLSENYITRMVFDFSRTVFMDSSGIGILLNRYKQMQRSGGSVAIYGVGVQINRILNLGGIWNLINGFSSKEAAIAGTEG